MARTFKDMQSFSEEKLNRIAREVTKTYALGNFAISQRVVGEKYNITPKCVRNLMDYAITESLVSLEIADLVAKKSKCNQQAKYAKAGRSTEKHDSELRLKRCKRIVEKLSTEQIQIICTDIANNPKEPILFFMKKYGFESEQVVKTLMEEAIIKSYVDQETFDALFARLPKSLKSEVYRAQLSLLREEHDKKGT